MLDTVLADRVNELDDLEDAGVAHIFSLLLHQGLGWGCFRCRILLSVFELLQLLDLISVIDELSNALDQATNHFKF